MKNLQLEIKKLELQINTDKALVDIHTSLLKQHIHTRPFVTRAMLSGLVGGFAFGYVVLSKKTNIPRKFLPKATSFLTQLYKNIRLVMPLIV